MKIWITGIAGFLGGYLSEYLSREGHIVNGNDNELCSSEADGYYITDSCDFQKMFDHFKEYKTEVLIHCAATAHEGLSNFSPSFITKNIYEASVATFSAAIAAGVKRIIFMSSMARYGGGNPLVFDCNDGPDLSGYEFTNRPPFREKGLAIPCDPYGIAKVAAEQTLAALCKLHKVEYVIAVPHNIIGPRQKYDDPYRNVASIMINRALQDKPILIYGDGEQMRCFSPISDCIDSLVKMITAPISGEIINIGPDSGEITVNELARRIADLTCSVGGIKHIPARPNEVKAAWCSSNKARKLLGFSPKQSLDDCLKEMVLYINEHGTKPFQYNFPIEIQQGCPDTWVKKLI